MISRSIPARAGSACLLWRWRARSRSAHLDQTRAHRLRVRHVRLLEAAGSTCAACHGSSVSCDAWVAYMVTVCSCVSTAHLAPSPAAARCARGEEPRPVCQAPNQSTDCRALVADAMSATTLSEPSEPSTPEIAVRTRRGDLEGVRELLEESVGSARRHRAANIESSDGLPVLSLACGNGHAAIASLLLAHGADVNRVDMDGSTALLDACARWRPARPATAGPPLSACAWGRDRAVQRPRQGSPTRPHATCALRLPEAATRQPARRAHDGAAATPAYQLSAPTWLELSCCLGCCSTSRRPRVRRPSAPASPPPPW